jgi:cytochrome c
MRRTPSLHRGTTRRMTYLERLRPAPSSLGSASARCWPLLLLICSVLAGCAEDEGPAWQVAGGNPKSGELLIGFYGCGNCHTIPGINGAEGVVGPPLIDFGKRSMIAGAVPNEPDNLIDWIVDPQTIEPGTAMPAVGATPAEARDIAAYLYTLR